MIFHLSALWWRRIRGLWKFPDGRDWLRGIWVLFWWVPCCLTWGQTMVEVAKIMATSFKRFQACTAALSARYPAADHCPPMPPLETWGHSQASLGQSLVGLTLLSPGSWCIQGFVCVLQESVSSHSVGEDIRTLILWPLFICDQYLSAITLPVHCQYILDTLLFIR